MRHTTLYSGIEKHASLSEVGAGTTSRAKLLKRAALLGGTALATGGLVTALPERATSASSRARDVRILNYVLRLESMKAAFYRDAAQGGALTGELQQLAEILARHERAHVLFLRNHLGSMADADRTYSFGDATRDAAMFATTARTLEETAVGGYIGQGPNLTRSLMVPFAQMCSVEARHVAWIADFLEDDPAPRPADQAKSPADVLAVIEQTGFEATS
jgi:hypothetical protein